ncbi:MAG: hypothetical protein ACOH1Q_08240 [Thiobacillus sp.]
MNRYFSMLWVGLACLTGLLVGCTGVNTFTTGARPGETVAVAIGYQQKVNRSNLTIIIMPQIGSPYTYNPGDTRIRTVFQAYPDPVSKLVVADRANTVYGTQFPDYIINAWGNGVRGLTQGDNDWSENIVLLDLPTNIASGMASLQLTSGGVNLTPAPIPIEVLSGSVATSQPFKYFQGTNPLQAPFTGAERAPHFVVQFTGPASTIPNSIAAVFSRTLGSIGDPWVTHGRGDLKNLMWSDNGSEIKVMLTPVKGTPLSALKDFKFYVTGSVASLNLTSLKAYDASGNPLSGFAATIDQVN